jgi:hypothetical protein
MTPDTGAKQTARRGELLAELFLQELGAQFVARSEISDTLFDFFIGFPNKKGGINTFAVEVKSTSRPVNKNYILGEKAYKVLANSNIPTLLLVVDVKENEFYYWWFGDHANVSKLKHDFRIPVVRMDSQTKRELIERMKK